MFRFPSVYSVIICYMLPHLIICSCCIIIDMCSLDVCLQITLAWCVSHVKSTERRIFLVHFMHVIAVYCLLLHFAWVKLLSFFPSSLPTDISPQGSSIARNILHTHTHTHIHTHTHTHTHTHAYTELHIQSSLSCVSSLCVWCHIL